jgi:hypothetical protein
MQRRRTFFFRSQSLSPLLTGQHAQSLSVAVAQSRLILNSGRLSLFRGRKPVLILHIH